MTCRMTGTCVDCERPAGTNPVVRPRGVITTDRVVAMERLLNFAERIAARRGGRVVLDLSLVDLLGAAAIDAILKRGDRLVLVNPSPRVRVEFQLLGLGHHLASCA